MHYLQILPKDPFHMDFIYEFYLWILSTKNSIGNCIQILICR